MILEKILSLIAPRACAVCGCRLSSNEDVICSTCNLHLPRTNFEGNPYENELAKEFFGRIPIEKATSLFYYHAGSEVANIIYNLKYHNEPYIGVVMGEMLANQCKGKDFFADIDAIVPVPLAKKRYKQRGYNQSMEIAKGVSKATGIPILSDLICRSEFNKSQTHLDRWQRAENVENLFYLNPHAKLPRNFHFPSNKDERTHLLIIDDIITTGATIVSCVHALPANVKISVLSLGFTKN